MTFTQLRYFVAVVECGFNVSKAALLLHTSQPGISRQIRVLEQSIGTHLLVRTNGRIIGLTEAGSKTFSTAKRVLKDVTSLKSMSEEYLQEEVGHLVIGTMHTHALGILPSAVAMLRKRYPGVTIEVRQASPVMITELCKIGELDIGLSLGQPEAQHRLLGFPLVSIPRVLIVQKNHPLLKKRNISLEDLLNYPMICQHSLSAGGWEVTRVFKEMGKELSPAIYAMDSSVIKAFVEKDAGIAVISGASFDPKRDTAIRAIDVSKLFQPSQLTAVIDPYRFLRGYTYDLITEIAPQWTKRKIDLTIREAISNLEMPLPATL